MPASVVEGARAGDRLSLGLAIFFAVVMAVSSVTGVVLLAYPGSTDRYFSWTLAPAAAASLVGGMYLASAAVFGWALTLPRDDARGLCAGVLGLAIPTLVFTAIDDQVFDFSRWQAVSWVTLFSVAAIFAGTLLAADRDRAGGDGRPPTWTRALLGVLAVAFAVLAVLIWLDATMDEVSAASPIALRGLTGKYIGAWSSFVAVLAGRAALLNTRAATRLALFALAAVLLGALVAAGRSFGDLSTIIPI